MARNVLGTTLQECSVDPLTGFTRNGCCETGPEDTGSHTVCVQVTDEFLAPAMTLQHRDLNMVLKDLKPVTGGAYVHHAGYKPTRKAMRHLSY